jgi:hypothetical protein
VRNSASAAARLSESLRFSFGMAPSHHKMHRKYIQLNRVAQGVIYIAHLSKLALSHAYLGPFILAAAEVANSLPVRFSRDGLP